MHPRHLVGVGARPLNFTVRAHENIHDIPIAHAVLLRASR